MPGVRFSIPKSFPKTCLTTPSTNSLRALSSRHIQSLWNINFNGSDNGTREFSNNSFLGIDAGQPIFETRPHLLTSGELTPGITALEYFERRLRLSYHLPKKSIAIVIGSNIKFATKSVFYEFIQNPDFYYLSGFLEPDSILIIEKTDSSNIDDEIIFHMFVPPKDPKIEQWEGIKTGIEGTKEIFNADEVYSNDNKSINLKLNEIINRNDTIYIDSNSKTNSNNNKNFFTNFFNIDNDEKLKQFNTTINDLLIKSKKSIKPLSPIITPLRTIKSNSEISIMRKAGRISGRAYNQVYANLKDLKTERDLQALLEYHFKRGGCETNAYFPVVASGDNARTIHYVRNDDLLKNGDMVLVDAAGRLGGYCSDISRTWPNNGKFTTEQAELYDAVLHVERECIKLCSVDKQLSLQGIHSISEDLMFESLKKLGFKFGTKWEMCQVVYPHYIGHNLGLDVHDVPGASRHTLLQQNQVITIEPGVYIPHNDSRCPKRFWGMGIRIEDDVAVGKESMMVLTSEAAKEIDDIEFIAENGISTPELK